jgi:hypothetical protein
VLSFSCYQIAGSVEREDEEGPDEGRRRCLNAFWAVGRRVEGSLFSGGYSAGPKMENRTEENRLDGVIRIINTKVLL